MTVGKLLLIVASFVVFFIVAALVSRATARRTVAALLWLADTQGDRGSWDPASNATIIPYTFAAPTPGERAWVAHFDAAFAGGSGRRVWNRLDIVAHVWNAAQVAQIPALYGSVAPPDLVERAAIEAALLRAKHHEFVHVQGNGTELSADLQTNLTAWKDQIWYQHICAYFAYAGIAPPEWAKCPAP